MFAFVICSYSSFEKRSCTNQVWVGVHTTGFLLCFDIASFAKNQKACIEGIEV